MAVERNIVEREVILERPLVRFEGMKVSWGEVWAGALVVLGALLVLTSLGLAVGVSAGTRNVSQSALGTGAAIWSALSLLIALFLGGMAATRLSMVWDRVTGLLQGMLVWVTSLVIVLYLNAVGVGLIFGSALGIVTRAAAQLVPEPTASAWIGFGAVVLSLLAALAGSSLGRRRAAQRAAETA